MLQGDLQAGMIDLPPVCNECCPKNCHVTAYTKFKNIFSDLWHSTSAIS